MTMSVVFNKLAFVRRLESEGAFSRGQAEALSEALHQAVNETVATKADLAEVRHELADARAELKHEIRELRTQVGHEIGELRTQMGHDLRELRGELKLWSGSLAAGLFAALGSLIAAMRFLGH
jgi:methionine aminopeptidase